MPGFTTKAIILKNYIYQDADKVYTFLSRDKGKISGIAKGVRKISSKRGGNLDTLNLVQVHLNPHKSGQNYITEVKTVETYKKAKQKLPLSKQGFYIAELINKFLQEDDDAEQVFDLTVSVLRGIEKDGNNITLVVNKFEIRLMQLLGYQPPNHFVSRWKNMIEQKQYEQADKHIKSFISGILQEDIKSLELS